MFERLRPRPHDIFSISELLGRVGSHLLSPGFYSSIPVNKRWIAHLSPLLWQTVDDDLYSWPQFLANNNNSNSGNSDNSDNDTLARGPVENTGLSGPAHSPTILAPRPTIRQHPTKVTSGQESKRPGTDRLGREMVTSLGRLTDFENQSDIVNVRDFLDRLLHLQNLVAPTFHLSTRMFSIIRMTPLRLRSTDLTGQILIRGLFTIPGRLPGLECLRVIGLSWNNVKDKDINIIMVWTPSNLRTLEYHFSVIQYVPTEKRILP
ncbi:hypothetical protein BGX30_003425 [Mortierella sp. GBA39]|nr:hypothetical protein BGX30_003425 [Mortierella sp. GBA39]